MSKYLMIESRDPFDTREVESNYQLAVDLAVQGNDITLFLIQNGVLPVRASAHKTGLSNLIQSGVKVVCDEYSLRERGIYSNAMIAGVEIGPLDIVIEHLGNQSKTLWL